jgi:hypothetical protein
VHIHDIPEIQLIEALQYALHLYTKGRSKSAGVAAHNGNGNQRAAVAMIEADNKDMHIGASSNDDDMKLLDLILSSPRNDEFLRDALKSLSLEELRSIIGYIHTWVNTYWHYTYDQLRAIRHSDEYKNYARFPSFSQILDWCSMLLDAHFSTISYMMITATASAPHDDDTVSTANPGINESISMLISSLYKLIHQHHLPHVEAIDDLHGFLMSFTAMDVKRKAGLLMTLPASASVSASASATVNDQKRNSNNATSRYPVAGLKL